MSQLSLFEQPKAAPERRAPNPDFIRKHLNRVLRLMRDAEQLPWSEAEAQSWEKQFPELAKLLPDEEAAHYCFQFDAEWGRLKAA